MGIISDKDRFDKDFADLIKRCRPDILKRLMHKGASKEEAEDFFQEALCLLLEGLAKGSLVIDDETSARLIEGRLEHPNLCGWLAETAIHKWLNEVKRMRKLREILEQLYLTAPLIVPIVDLDRIIACLEKILPQLSKECQEILQGHLLDGKPLADIAKSLGLTSLQAIHRRIHECLRQARRFLGDSDCLFI